MVNNLRIVQAGLGKKAASLIEVGMSPKDVAAALNVEDADKMTEFLVPLTVRDVLEYKQFLDTLESTEVGLLVKGSAEEKRVAARVRERLEKTLDLMEAVEKAAKDTREDMEMAREKWRDEVSQGLMPSNYFPAKQMGLLLKVVAEGRQLVQVLHQDQGVQSFIKNATVNVNQTGMSQKDVYQCLRFMSKELGVDMDRMMEAWGEAQEALTVKRGVIDV